MPKLKSYLSDEVTVVEAEIQSLEQSRTADEARILTLETNYANYTSGPFWDDYLGDVAAKSTGPLAPTLDSMIGGNVKAWFYGTNNECNLDYHPKHDYVPDTDLYFHLHWGS